jgi:hypothetical protein
MEKTSNVQLPAISNNNTQEAGICEMLANLTPLM